jgi:hypothetical protein
MLGELGDAGEQLAASEQEAFARAGHTNATPRALEEPDTQLRLEIVDLPPQRRLSDAQPGGGSGEGARLGDRDEVAEVTELHFVYCYGGREDNTFYRRRPEGLQVAGGKQLEIGDTALFGKSLIHAVVNPLRVFTGAIHIYGGDFFGTPRSDWDPESLRERPYDVRRARKVVTDANERWLAEHAAAPPGRQDRAADDPGGQGSGRETTRR